MASPISPSCPKRQTVDRIINYSEVIDHEFTMNCSITMMVHARVTLQLWEPHDSGKVNVMVLTLGFTMVEGYFLLLV